MEYENLMMCSYLTVHKAVAVEGFVGFLGFYLSCFVLYLFMVECHRNPPSQRIS